MHFRRAWCRGSGFYRLVNQVWTSRGRTVTRRKNFFDRFFFINILFMRINSHPENLRQIWTLESYLIGGWNRKILSILFFFTFFLKSKKNSSHEKKNFPLKKIFILRKNQKILEFFQLFSWNHSSCPQKNFEFKKFFSLKNRNFDNLFFILTTPKTLRKYILILDPYRGSDRNVSVLHAQSSRCLYELWEAPGTKYRTFPKEKLAPGGSFH